MCPDPPTSSAPDQSFSDQSLIGREEAKAFRELFNQFPTDYSALRTATIILTQAFHDALAARFEQPFNEFLRTLPQNTPSEKQQLAKLANQELSRVGLAIRDPGTGRSAFLMVDPSTPPAGAFRLEILDENKKRIRGPRQKQLPHLELQGYDFSRQYGVDHYQHNQDAGVIRK